jgi:hypothetical protein
MSSHIQAVLFSTNSNNDKDKKWLLDDNLINIKPVHKTENYKRYRIKPLIITNIFIVYSIIIKDLILLLELKRIYNNLL